MKSIELLAPARDFVVAKAAIDYGADALYIGAGNFGARAAATNSTIDIRRVIDYAHRFGVRVYVTMNTLLYDSELSEAERVAREVVDAGADALIVQDMAYLRMGLPIELHASTQVCNMTPERVRFLGECGFARVILERGLSLAQINEICSATDVDIETFVHGAICVGYSGRCFLSRSISSRSGNRGECSQPCRLTYDLVDASGRKIIEGKHLLSVRDMNLSHRLGELLDAGVSSFKIEGRLKDERYIKNVVAHYRRSLDVAIAEREGLCRSSYGTTTYDFTPDPAKSFTRGESEYFFDGKRRGVASFDTPKSVGEYIGRVVRSSARWFELDREHTIAAGDGICFSATGTNVNSVEGVRIFPNRMEGISVGVDIFRNYDHRFSLSLDRSRTRRVLRVDVRVKMSEDVISMEFTRADDSLSCEIVRHGNFAPATNEEKMMQTLHSQLAKMGDTHFTLGELLLEGSIRFVPASLISDMRREGLSRLAEVGFTMQHKPFVENLSAQFPDKALSCEDNVTNRLAEEFYRSHGVERIAPPLEAADDMSGERVMRSAYCLRREIGECLKENPRLKGELFLQRGAYRYRLDFDCRRCEMSLIKCER